LSLGAVSMWLNEFAQNVANRINAPTIPTNRFELTSPSAPLNASNIFFIYQNIALKVNRCNREAPSKAPLHYRVKLRFLRVEPEHAPRLIWVSLLGLLLIQQSPMPLEISYFA
jgi:hypothetical protein